MQYGPDKGTHYPNDKMPGASRSPFAGIRRWFGDRLDDLFGPEIVSTRPKAVHRSIDTATGDYKRGTDGKPLEEIREDRPQKMPSDADVVEKLPKRLL